MSRAPGHTLAGTLFGFVNAVLRDSPALEERSSLRTWRSEEQEENGAVYKPPDFALLSLLSTKTLLFL